MKFLPFTYKAAHFILAVGMLLFLVELYAILLGKLDDGMRITLIFEGTLFFGLYSGSNLSRKIFILVSMFFVASSFIFIVAFLLFIFWPAEIIKYTEEIPFWVIVGFSSLTLVYSLSSIFVFTRPVLVDDFYKKEI